MGPDALRVAGLAEALQGLNLQVIDRGNLHGPANPWQQPVNGLRHLKEAIDWNQAVYDAVEAAFKDGHFPMMLGGDHCLAIGSISAVAAHCRRQEKAARAVV
jgi:arginase